MSTDLTEADPTQTDLTAAELTAAELIGDDLISDDAGYRPRLAAAYWAEIGDFVRAVVAETVAGTAYTPRELFAAATPLTMWAWQSAGFPLERDVIFSIPSIERFVAVGLPQYRSKSGRNTIRSRLLRISEQVGEASTVPVALRPLGRSSPSAPYPEADIVRLMGWAAFQSTPARRSNAETLLALGLGGGLAGREIINLTVGGIRADGDGVIVTVDGERARSVPVLREWERPLVDLRQSSGDAAWAFRQEREATNRNLISDFVSRSTGTVPLQARRMHATWIVQHLEAGTPVVLLLRAAGLSSPEALDRFLPFVRPSPETLFRSSLRDAAAAAR